MCSDSISTPKIYIEREGKNYKSNKSNNKKEQGKKNVTSGNIEVNGVEKKNS